MLIQLGTQGPEGIPACAWNNRDNLTNFSPSLSSELGRVAPEERALSFEQFALTVLPGAFLFKALQPRKDYYYFHALSSELCCNWLF